MKTTRHDTHYDDGMYVMYTGRGQNVWKQRDRGVANDTLWMQFQNLGDIFLS